MSVRIVIDGKEIEAQDGSTILETARRAGISIPTLCHHEGRPSPNPCGLCVVEVEGEADPVRSCVTVVQVGMTIVTASKRLSTLRKERLAKLGETHFGDCKAPCNLTCPGQINVQGYIAHVAKGEYEEALRLVMDKNPFPFSVGRVCPRFCETRCRRILVDEPVSINHLKRFVADWCMTHDVDLMLPREPTTGKSIAVVGGGPAGMTCAFYLAAKGHDVTVFEAMPQLGGMLRYGLPEYKIPRNVLDYEMTAILRMGISVKLNQRWGVDFTLQDLKDQGFDATFLAIGAWAEQPLEIPGATLPGVYAATTVLRDIAMGRGIDYGRRAAVIGGNNIAMEAARSLLRSGVDEVTVIFPKSRTGMSANQRVIMEAEREGVQFLMVASPVQIRKGSGGLDIEMIRMKLGEPDAKGVRHPEPILGSNNFLQVDTVVHSLGQMAFSDETVPRDGLDGGLKLSGKNTIEANVRTALTSLDGVFAAGDAVSGHRTVIQTVVAARRAAENIHSHVMGAAKEAGESRFNFTRGKTFDDVDLRNFEGVKVKLREKMPTRPPATAIQDFDEIKLGFSEQMAKREAARCLSCGCLAYDRCDFKEVSIAQGVDPNKIDLPSAPMYPRSEAHPALVVDRNKCVLCGRCVASCRYGALSVTGRRDEDDRVRDLAIDFNDRCVSCGRCADACSTGALVKKGVLVPITGEAVRRVDTTCPYCGTGCQVQLHVKGKTLMEVTADPNRAPNHGDLCVKGRFGQFFVQHPDRLTTPLVRRKKGGPLEPTSWDEALDMVAGTFRCIMADRGPDAIAGLSSARCTTEENYAFQKFFRAVIGTNNVDHCARY